MTTTEQYLHDRLIAIGLTDEANKRTIYEDGKAKEIQILRPNNSNQSIMIPYTTPTGEIAVYMRDGRILPFERQRYTTAREYEEANGEKKQQRYSQPKDSGVFTYMTPGIVKRVRLGDKIDTLFVVEGEIKALAGDVLGLDIIGLGGIQNFRNKEENEIDAYIKEVIEKCQPDNVVLLFDADCLAIKHEDETKDLYTRLNNFRGAVVGFMEMMKAFQVDVYFTHIDEKFTVEAKGLDDLLAKLKQKDKEKLKKELLSLTVGNKSYTKCQKLERGGSHTIARYFRCDNVNNFYEAYKSIIQERSFKYRGSNYFYDGTKLQLDGAPAARAYIYVAGKYFRLNSNYNERKDPERKNPIEKIELVTKEAVKKEVKNLSLIPIYHKFVNVPCNTDGYEKFITCTNNGIDTVGYNLYSRVMHDITPGSWENTEKFLRHIFSSKNTAGENLYEFGLDYIQHTFFYPKRRMPVLVLTSSEKNTGKTTLLNWMKDIFGENACVLDNDRFSGRFNDHYVNKLVVGVEEVYIGENTVLKERIKNYATSDDVPCEAKGLSVYQTDNYMHMILVTNRETDFMQIDDDENRFAIIKVPTLKSDDPFILSKMRAEVGHFLHYLSQREFHYSYDKSRFGFSTKVYETDGLKKIQERTEFRPNKEIKNYIYECFVNYGVNELYFTPKDLAQGINNEGGFSISKTTVKDILKYEFEMEPEKLMRYYIYSMEYDSTLGAMRTGKPTSKTGTPYKFKREDFIDNSENDQ